MNSILYKYRSHSDEYLIYDQKKNKDQVDAIRARSLLSQNFGLGARGILAGPVIKEGRPSMLLFTPDGKEQLPVGISEQFEKRFLEDAGYLTEGSVQAADISFAGKVFVFAKAL